MGRPKGTKNKPKASSPPQRPLLPLLPPVEDPPKSYSDAFKGKSFGLHRHEKDLIASFHTKEAQEEFLEKNVLSIAKAEVHAALGRGIFLPVSAI